MQGLLFYFLNIILQGIGVFVKQIFASNGLYLSKKTFCKCKVILFFFSCKAEFDLYVCLLA